VHLSAPSAQVLHPAEQAVHLPAATTLTKPSAGHVKGIPSVPHVAPPSLQAVHTAPAVVG